MRPSGRAREALLNLLLAVLVLTSVALSVRIWYPEPLFGDADAAEPSLQQQPVPAVREMPEIFRPERIAVVDADRLHLRHAGLVLSVFPLIDRAKMTTAEAAI
ncbi:MAG: hypothetical protein DIU55_008275, partial [Bacillota bacterium]